MSRSLSEICNQMKRLVEDTAIVTYLIVDRCSGPWSYNIYGDGIYTNLSKAEADYENELKKFKSWGPDDNHRFSLYQCNLNPQDFQELQQHYNKYLADSGYSEDKGFFDFMERICRQDGKEIAAWAW